MVSVPVLENISLLDCMLVLEDTIIFVIVEFNVFISLLNGVLLFQ